MKPKSIKQIGSSSKSIQSHEKLWLFTVDGRRTQKDRSKYMTKDLWFKQSQKCMAENKGERINPKSDVLICKKFKDECSMAKCIEKFPK